MLRLAIFYDFLIVKKSTEKTKTNDTINKLISLTSITYVAYSSMWNCFFFFIIMNMGTVVYFSVDPSYAILVP